MLSETLPGNEVLVHRLLAEGHELGHHMTRDAVTVRLDDDVLNEDFHGAAQAL